MEPFEELRKAVLRQSAEGDFPDWLLAEVLGIADAPQCYAERRALVLTLAEQINDYDPFAGAGCFNTAISLTTIQATIRRIQSG